jgi:hypothetical protein
MAFHTHARSIAVHNVCTYARTAQFCHSIQSTQHSRALYDDVRSDAMRCVYRLSLFGVRDSSELRTSRKSHEDSHDASVTRMLIQTL